MPSNIVLVTGVSGELGGRLLSRLGACPGLDRIVGVDISPPSRGVLRQLGRLSRVEFVRADIRNPLLAKIMTSAKVDTVVHVGPLCHPAGYGERADVKEANVIGTMRLLAACQNSPYVRKLVVASTTAVYGASSRSQAVFTEDAELIPAVASGYSKDAVELEGYVRGFARRRPDVGVTTLRFADIVAGDLDTVFSRYFSLPLVPTVLGFDARLQFLHAEDALTMLEQATTEEKPGVFNVAGDGVLTLSQAIRRAGRIALPVPRPVMTPVGKVLRGAHAVNVSADLVRLLNFGRVVDTTRLVREFGYSPRWTTRQAFDEAVRTATSWRGRLRR
ncbi:NAD-dependent epimerase/dehydratase family protein [Saccharomonospora viridis]|uniref:Nucleoside-diphosphate-sugar epimerase n=1 Tax=Saccharomonospora viridis (strain ATCC 15386 / DSM 43017 / JCM 3036 / CCUG 5913 / NBRC 12207 / NCIMB 9602 / P101) TaxID=471857 RepID=C7MSZ8_SACVD|nr:NAD-dependent epimerase/dehydratase family protein [Saccharomonospora viridis]ACU95359.1 nucleoside-diphosphate-sugar epimerase [Saccharomonospora viridis DSM 43017]